MWSRRDGSQFTASRMSETFSTSAAMFCFISILHPRVTRSLPGDRGWQVRSGCKIKPGVQLTLHRLLRAILPRVPPRSCLLRFDCVEGSSWDEWGHKLGILRVAYLLVPVFSLRYIFMRCRVDHVQPVSDYGLCPQPEPETGGVGGNVNPVGKPADDIRTVSHVCQLLKNVSHVVLL